MFRGFIEKIKIYETMRIPILGGIWYRLTSNIDNYLISKEKIPDFPLNKEKRNEIVIASLTSYPARINYVHIAIKSLMIQTYKPDRIVLSLAKNQFDGIEIPQSLTELQKYGLEIFWMDDLYGHKKYYNCIKNQKENELVISFDDDIIYSPYTIERLMLKHNKFPDCLVCERGQTYDSDKSTNPGRWKTISDIGVNEPTFNMNPSPGSGCLIPYGAFHKDAIDKEKIYSLAYKNDDMWYMFMCVANNTQMIKTRKYHKIFTLIKGSQTERMAVENIINNKNEDILKGLIKEYPSVWEKITNIK